MKKLILLICIFMSLGISAQTSTPINPKDIIGKWKITETRLSVVDEEVIYKNVMIDKEESICQFFPDGTYTNSIGQKGIYKITDEDELIIKFRNGSVLNYILQELSPSKMQWLAGNDGVLQNADIQYLISSPSFDKKYLQDMKKLKGKTVMLATITCLIKM